MQTLHVLLKQLDSQRIELRYYFANSSDYQALERSLSEISDLVKLAERDYYNPLPEDFARTGQRLYHWLDGDLRWLTQAIASSRRQGLIIAISTQGTLAHLPWEVLHDGQTFLVASQNPVIIPVRWVPEENPAPLSEPATRPLQVLFMATSPENTNTLDFEDEERAILAATEKLPLSFRVEESGCLTELADLIREGEECDVFHLTGHADITEITGHADVTEKGGRFITETEIGERYYASAKEIYKCFQFRCPQLFFLSGCRTGEAGKAGLQTSMAEEMLESGAPAVLSWGRPVLETDATAAAAALYRELSAGYTLPQAVALTYQSLLENQARDWHLLRLYVAGEVPGAFVLPPNRQTQKAKPQSIRSRNFDAEGKKQVATAGEFVGRRRVIQRCLRELKCSRDRIGVLLQGMGGLGKSTLAKRLSDRLSDYQMVVWVDPIDPENLVQRLSRYLQTDLFWLKSLNEIGQSLEARLEAAFNWIDGVNQSGSDRIIPPFLLVFDDFENSLTQRGEGYGLKPDAAKVLSALVRVLRQKTTRHRIIITSRYQFAMPDLQYFEIQTLDGLRGGDLQKKCDRLKMLHPQSSIDRRLKQQCLELADGNPRLLEWLEKLLSNQATGELSQLGQILTDLAANPLELREQVLAKELIDLIDPSLQKILQRGLIFDLPVPRSVMLKICEDRAEVEMQLNRAIALGLLEVSPDQSLRVPRILPISRLENDESLCRQAAELLYQQWWEGTETYSETQALEIHRLAFRGKAAEIAAELGDRITSQWINKSQFQQTAKLCEETLTLTVDYRILHQLARAEDVLGAVDNAREHYQQALANCPAADEKEKSAIIHNMAGLKANQGEVSDAIALYEESLALEKGINNVQGIAATLHQLGRLKANQGEVSKAIALYEKSLALAKGINNVQGIATTLHQLAILKADQGEVSDAIALYEESLALQKGINNVQGIAATLHCLAILKADQGEVSDAIALYEESLALTKGIKDVKTIAATLHCLAGLKANQGEVSDAIALYEESLALAKRINDVQGIAATLHQLADLKANQGEVSDAIALYEESLALKKRINNVQGIAATLHQLADLKANQGEVSDAIALYEESLALEKGINNVQGIAATLATLGQLLADKRGDFTTGLSYLQESLTILQHLRSPHAATVQDIINDVQQMAANS